MNSPSAAAALLALALCAAASPTPAEIRPATPPLNRPRIGPVALLPLAIPPETCMGIDPNQMVITGGQTPINPGSGALGSWLLRANSGAQSLVIAYLDYKSDAQTIITIAKARHWNRICFVGTRGGGSYMYPLAADQ